MVLLKICLEFSLGAIKGGEKKTKNYKNRKKKLKTTKKKNLAWAIAWHKLSHIGAVDRGDRRRGMGDFKMETFLKIRCKYGEWIILPI